MYDNRKVAKFVALLGIWLIFMLLFIVYEQLTGLWFLLLLISSVIIQKKIDNYFDKK
ncbi:hypothetical protein FOL01_0045 [Weissella jogaejeotgali]|uniref:Uncharacterized protein n=1 Tax=Weissella jogaejeotgali TaxID=1631871 RepID=A0A1L6R8N7_9LACO|nr:hypothetical protein [Weissella jogaejeotgali]APS40904.1 hypothetical protein FOL01_0045 [Weissella jogaejeotgali]